MRKYEVVAYPIECDDGTVEWGAKFPAVFGCAGGGSTPEEAIAEAYENLELHLKVMEKEGIPIPSESEEYSGKILLHVSKQTHQMAIKSAKAQGLSLNAFINEALSFKLGQRYSQ
jgi:predicted RNase H-like HicB family nuclease